MTTDTHHEAVEAEAEAVTVDATEGEQARELLAKARYDAFRMVTDGRKEAESILDEAKDEAARILETAKETAASVLASAETEAGELRTSTEETASDSSATEAAVAELEEERQQLTDRVGSLRTLADQLEERFAALATHADTSDVNDAEPPPIQTPTEALPIEPPVETAEPESPGAVEPAPIPEPAVPFVKPVIDYSPSVPPPPKASEVEDVDDDVPVERGSFYSRRSAKLPSIGDAGGKSALDMMRAIRENSDDH